MELIALCNRAEVMGEVDASGQGQVEGAPKLGIDFHQFVVVVAHVVTKLHHCHAVPFEPVEQSSSVLFELRIVVAGRTAAYPTLRGSLSHPPMHEDALANAMLVQRKEAASVSGDVFLNQRKGAAGAVVSLTQQVVEID